MDLKTLQIDVGGLCMLVRNTNEPAGLFLLFPVMHKEQHCPLLVVEREYSENQRRHVAQLDRHPPLDFRRYSDNGPGNPLSKSYLEFSKFATPPVAVDEKWLTDPPSGALAARVALPLDASENPSPDKATLNVPDPRHPKVTAVGETRFTIKVRVPFISRLEVAGLALVPRGDGVIRFSVLNVRSKDFVGKKYKRSIGDVVHHVQAYYGLLKGWPESKEGPPITAAAAQDGEVDNHLPGKPCGEVTADEVGIRYVDPYNCTIGIGCPPGQDTC